MTKQEQAREELTKKLNAKIATFGIDNTGLASQVGVKVDDIFLLRHGDYATVKEDWLRKLLSFLKMKFNDQVKLSLYGAPVISAYFVCRIDVQPEGTLTGITVLRNIKPETLKIIDALENA